MTIIERIKGAFAPGPKHCPICGAVMDKVIFCGLPGHLCTDQLCNCLTGLAGWAPPIATPWGEFAFFAYTGSYWPALVEWLRGGNRDE